MNPDDATAKRRKPPPASSDLGASHFCGNAPITSELSKNRMSEQVFTRDDGSHQSRQPNAEAKRYGHRVTVCGQKPY
jgi:hypothetical protein